MTIVRTTESPAYYGNGEVLCQDCITFGKQLVELHCGEFENQALTIAEIGVLIKIAKNHERVKEGHKPFVAVFARNTEQVYREQNV